MPLPFPTPGQHDLVVLTRNGPMSYYTGEDGESIKGLEHDLVEAFARELGVGVQYIVASPHDIDAQLNNTPYHLAMAWLSPGSHPELKASPPIFSTYDILAQDEASLPLTETRQLADKTVHVLAGSRQAANLQLLKREISGLNIEEVPQGDVLDLIEKLGNGTVEYVAMDAMLEDIANQFNPSLRTSLPLGDKQDIVWLLGPEPNVELQARVQEFIARIKQDGTLAQLEERYFGHVRRLTQADIESFLGRVETTLPKLRRWFQSAAAITGIDWRLIAAVAYHESHWDPNATSYTNVRGIMMLTEETADRLGVSNRLDPRESILAGARYINLLKSNLPDNIQEPDRTWLALAAYNIGPGHFNAGRNLAKYLKTDPDSWYSMKKVLPMLAQAKYAEKVRAGRARGGEAVILVENIRSYYDILVRHEPIKKMPEAPESTTGIKLKAGEGLGQQARVAKAKIKLNAR